MSRGSPEYRVEKDAQQIPHLLGRQRFGIEYMFEQQRIGKRAKAGDRRFGRESRSTPQPFSNPAQEITATETHALQAGSEPGMSFGMTNREKFEFKRKKRHTPVFRDPRIVRAQSL